MKKPHLSKWETGFWNTTHSNLMFRLADGVSEYYRYFGIRFGNWWSNYILWMRLRKNFSAGLGAGYQAWKSWKGSNFGYLPKTRILAWLINPSFLFELFGTPGWVRTSGFQLRRLTLYPLSYGRFYEKSEWGLRQAQASRMGNAETTTESWTLFGFVLIFIPLKSNQT